MLIGLIFYGCCIGVFSSRKIERATFDSIAFRYISGDYHPDHDTINSLRKRFLTQIKELFKQILIIATEAGVLKIGNVSFDGTKVNANASKHKAISYGHASKLEQKVKEEVELLLEKVHEENEPDEISIPKNSCADTGYLSETNIDAMVEREIEPYIATGREHHHSYLEDKLNGAKVEIEGSKALSKIEKMKRKLRSEEGKEIYRYRKMTVEPVFGIIKQAMGFRRFSFRGQEKVSKEWGLVCLAYNLRRLFTLNLAV